MFTKDSCVIGLAPGVVLLGDHRALMWEVELLEGFYVIGPEGTVGPWSLLHCLLLPDREVNSSVLTHAPTMMCCLTENN